MPTRTARLASKLLGILAVALVVARAPGSARADVVQPAPTNCPRGKVGTTSHGGPECVLDAPKDCPVGWRGALGGTCQLTPCTGADQCRDGEACVEHSVCLQASVDDSYDYGEEEREEHGQAEPPADDRLLRSPALLAGPPIPRTKRPVPIYRYDATNLCSADVACVAPRTCQTEKLCVPKGARAAAYLGANISPMRVARKTAAPLTASDARPTEATAPPPMKRGCAGCAAASGDASAAGVGGLAALAAALTVRRRRRARTSR
jgi:MYXO-CTERM domain-containing protein